MTEIAASINSPTIAASITADTITATIAESTIAATLGSVGPAQPATPFPAVATMRIAGHSYLPNTASYLDDNDDTLARTLRRMFGTRPEGYLNHARSGGAVSDHTSSSSWSRVVDEVTPTRTFPYTADCGLAVINYGTNDAILGTATNEKTGYKESMKTVFSRMCASATFDNDSSTITADAGWTNTDHGATPRGGGSGNWTTTTVGAVLTITVPSDFEGGWVGLVFPGANAGGTAAIAVDGVADGTVSTGNMHSSNYSSKYAARTYRTELTAGTHTITVTCTAQTNSGTLHFNGWHIEATPSPVVAVLENVTPSSPSGIWSGISAARQATYNEWLVEAIAEFNADSDDTPVFLVELEDLLDADEAYFADDGLHPNARGAALMAAEVYKAVASRLRLGRTTPKQLAGYAFDADPEVSFDWLRSDWDVHEWVEDTFARDDDATGLGTGESGHEWTVVDSTGVSATLGISSNQAYLPAGSTRTIATVETGSPDGEWIVDIGNNGGSDRKVGSVMRFVDADNYIAVESFPNFATMGVYLRYRGGSTLLDNTGFSGSVGDVRCVLQGDTVTVYQDNVLACTITDARFLDLRSPKMGFFLENTTARIDDVAGKHYSPVVTDWTRDRRLVQIQVTDPNGAALTTGDGKAYFTVPADLDGWSLVDADASLVTVSSSGLPTVQLHNLTDAVDMLSTRITIDANERTSYTATAPVIDTANDEVSTGDLLRVDVDVAGTGAKGLSVLLAFAGP
jgi:lysophospholipase L1-like esterase